MSVRYKLGIDVGGTFTDLFLWSSDGTVATAKTLSTPADPSLGVLDGLRVAAEGEGLAVEELARRVTTIVHGTTVTTNAALTRGGARTGLVTTAGVRDALEMRRGIREEQYDNRYRNVEPLVPRHLRRPVRGRLDYRGAELEPLELDDVRDAARRLGAAGVDAVAVCFMNSFADPAHERAAAALLREELPDAFVSVSSELLPTIRFYNRVSTTVLNAYVGPILERYLKSLTEKLASVAFAGTLLVMQSNGGVALPASVRTKPATTLLSGPAGGPAAALAFAEPHGGDDCILADMGGTSFDATLVRGGAAAMYAESDLDRLRIALPMLAITTIGAGGGSIGWIDEGGLLRMGPRSAGALPGPACYGRGGEQPTCTDASLVLGYLDPSFFAGGELALDVDLAAAAVRQHVAEPLGTDVEAAAAGMYRVINTNMAHGVREITVKRGVDPREFPLVVAGGAGALHACMIALELDLPSLVVPPIASVLCAAGMLQSDLAHDFLRSYVCRFSELDVERAKSLFEEAAALGGEQLASEGIPAERIAHALHLDLRYAKQYHEVSVSVPFDLLAQGDLERIAGLFHREHDRLYGYELADQGTELELINLRVRSTGETTKPPLPVAEQAGEDASGARKGVRRAFVPEAGDFVDVQVFDGHALRPGNVLSGPALIERADTTIFVSSSFDARVDAYSSCILTRREP
ncbi:MAG TPA: hydantoinase/oxoprolinase family protein [Planctomycetota bacterium]|nr:hydantoinase/oxoprolinase family protein [Planctomycetota bacterium]